jgi:hypothetical protein
MARPLTVTLAVHAGTQNSSATPVLSFTPAADGTFRVTLPPGDYCVVRAEERTASDPADGKTMYVDPGCMASWRAGCDAIWHVSPEDELDGSFNVPGPCFGPCYRGPMPP